MQNTKNINFLNKTQMKTIDISETNYEFITQPKFANRLNDTFDNCLSHMIQSYKILEFKFNELEREINVNMGKR